MFGTPSSNLTSYNISLFKKLVLLVAGVAVLAISAHIKVPFYPVPITMQTLVVMLIGFTYGIRLGSSTVLVYLALGAIGAPVLRRCGFSIYGRSNWRISLWFPRRSISYRLLHRARLRTYFY